MKKYRIKEITILPPYLLIIFLVCTKINNIGVVDLFFLIIGIPALLFVVIWMHLLRLIISDDDISISLMFNNKMIKKLKNLKWDEVWIIDCRHKKYHIILVPKREAKESHRYKWSELFMIPSNFMKQSEILETIIKNAPDAKILPVEK